MIYERKKVPDLDRYLSKNLCFIYVILELY